jgi:DNA-binding protein Fis
MQEQRLEEAGFTRKPGSAPLNLQRGYLALIDEHRNLIIQEALRQTEGNNSKAAELLGMDKGNFSRLRKRITGK